MTIPREKVIPYSIITIILVQSLSLISSIILQDIGYDFKIYYDNIKGYWLNGESYFCGFFYLDYFLYIYFFMAYIPLIIGLLIHIFITDILFYFTLKTLQDKYEAYWYYANMGIMLFCSFTFNIDIWIIFSLLYFQKYRDKWFSPFFMFLAFFKITTIIIFGVLFLINYIFERKLFYKQIPGFLILFSIVGFSFLNSYSLIYQNANNFAGNISDFGIFLYIQPSHLTWISIPLLVLFKKMEIPIIKVKKIWNLYFKIVLIYFLFSFLSTLISLLANKITKQKFSNC